MPEQEAAVTTLQLSPATRSSARTRKARNRHQVPATVATAERVREMLLEIAFVLHATRVVGKLDEAGVAATKG